ncbi:hypothetical protein PFICI_11867 [Pestalotiopsis fici W106-1]|uniref:Uncharacterized protein n=1 Tax=Pestalotiopsis fici (strain W106-1 / CGMCC3.15140) TaxID=1229662 RepID=W3WRI7_PESFW|nr:uncharacterized protein PFICI_11867 [Pestalotiopsis fici W106-1]ETS76480.1 hypothetical protein PFICI_11867 [Pestalotiopsis fici W106-1]
MYAFKDFAPFLSGSPLSSVQSLLVVLGILFSLFIVSGTVSRRRNEPPRMQETIPYVSNILLFMTDQAAFLDLVQKTFKKTGSHVIKCYIGFRPLFFVAGPRNVQRLFGSPDVLDGNFIHFLLMSMQWGMSATELSKFKKDRSGRLPKPIPGSGPVTEDQRYWRSHSRLYTDFLSDPRYSEALGSDFLRRFTAQLDQWQEDTASEWTTARLLGTLKTQMSRCAAETLFGTRLFDLNPGFTECYWQYDEVAGKLLLGLPSFLMPEAARAKRRLHAMVRRHIDSAWASQSAGDVDAECLWEPHFGSRLSRESAMWMRAQGFSDHAAAGHTLASLFGLNGNTVPITAWALMELIKDPSLLAAVRSEILEGGLNAETGELDAQRVMNLALLQSIYIETMRLHVSFNVSREVRDGPFEIVPGCWADTGAIIQTCSTVAHLDEEVWGVDQHPASEFWAWRHVQTEEAYDDLTGRMASRSRFVMRARPTSFFPYGGGYWVCPGRHFGKMEIMLALALIVIRFDLEFVKWTNLDGSETDRPAVDDKRYAGSIAMFPDRDLCFRWRKRQLEK